MATATLAQALFGGPGPMDGLVLEVTRGLSTALAIRGSAVPCPDCVCQCAPTLACSEGALPQEFATATWPSGPTLFGLGVVVGALGVAVAQRWASGARATAPPAAVTAVETGPVPENVAKLALEQLEAVKHRFKQDFGSEVK